MIKKAFHRYTTRPKNMCTERVLKETSLRYERSTSVQCAAFMSFSELEIFAWKQLPIQADSIKFLLLVFLAVKDDRWGISDCEYESIKQLTWILSSSMLSSSARSSRIWMPGNFSISKESSNRFSCSSVNTVRRRLCRDLSPRRSNGDC